MIKYNNNTINEWYFYTSDIVKVYRNNAICYYKITVGGGQVPCFAVVDDISQYSDTEFVDVYNKADGKWYKLNNLNQYEQYGIYGKGRTSCEGSSRLPQGYTEVEYIRQNSNYDAYINTGVILFDNTSNTYTVTTKLASEFHSNLGCATIISAEVPVSPYNGMGYRYKCSSTVDQLEFFGGNSNYTSSVVDNGDGTRTVTFQSTGNTSWTSSAPLSLLCSFSDTSFTTPFRYADATIYYATVVKNGVTVRDFVPAKRDSDSVYGLYDLINDVFYTSPNGNNFSGGEPTDCVTTYEGKLTIDNGYEYQYSGGSWINVGEVSGSTRVPQGYTEVEYIQNTGTSYINTNFLVNQDTRIVTEMQTVTNTSYGRFVGAGGYNKTNAVQFDYETGANGTLHVSWGAVASWATYSNCTGDYNRHIYDWDKNYFYRDKGETNQFSASTTYTSFQCTDNLGVFCNILNSTAENYMKGKMYSFQLYDNDTLIRDLVPCTRDSDSKAGAYDVVNDVFYVSPNNTNFVAGSATISLVYPIYYDEMQDPPDNLTFSSMTEAEDYECPWVGMKATIDGDKYIFSGDSISGYEWVEIISPIPSEYNELEYIEVPRVSRTTTSANLFAVPVDLQAYHKYVLDFTPVNFWDTSYYGVMLGGNDADTNFHDLGIFKLDNGWGTGKMIVSCLNYQLGRTKFNISPYIIQNTRTVISMHMNGYVANNGASISIESNGVEVFTGSSTTKANSSYNPTIGIRNVPLLDIGSSGNNTYTANLKFHNFAVMTSSDELVYNYLPVERISDGQAGLFETVNQVFYPLLGYTVTKGDPV